MYWIAVIAIFAVLCVLCRDKTNRWRAIPVCSIIGSFFFKVWYLGVAPSTPQRFGLLSRFLNGVIAVFTKLSWLGLKWGLLVALVMIMGIAIFSLILWAATGDKVYQWKEVTEFFRMKPAVLPWMDKDLTKFQGNKFTRSDLVSLGLTEKQRKQFVYSGNGLWELRCY